MDIVDESTLDSLINWDGAPCVSVYLPTHRVGRETEADPILFKNLLARAEHELVEGGMRPPAAVALLADGRRLLTDAAFWHHQEDGLAFFAAPKRTESFRVPASFAEMVIVTEAFHVKPLWPVVSRGERFSMLTLSWNRIRLFWATKFRVGEIDLPNEVPQSLEEALRLEDPERQLQSHVGGRVGRGAVVQTFHGSPDVREDEDALRFFRAVDDGVLHLVDRERPMVLAGVEETVALYRKVSRHPTILDDTITGNADRATPDDLHARAWSIAEPYFTRVVVEDGDAFLASGSSGVRTVPEAVAAARQARVAAIFVPTGTQVWGTVGSSGDVVVHDLQQPGDRDLLDMAAIAVWRTGGRVHVVAADAIPGDGPVAVLLRY